MATITPVIINPLPELAYCTLVKVEKGSFTIGSMEDKDSQPLTPITFNHDFYMGQYPVTQALWERVMGNSRQPPSYFKGSHRPVEQVSWDDICGKDGFLERLHQQDPIKNLLQQQTYKGMRFQLPSEAQWEYAAKGGKDGQDDAFAFAGSNNINKVAWCDDNSHRETKPVGLKAPNQLGLYDMSGNVWEWCADDWHGDYKAMDTAGKPRINGAERAPNRVLRGGSYFNYARQCRSAYRNNNWPDNRSNYIGFRLVLCLQF